MHGCPPGSRYTLCALLFVLEVYGCITLNDSCVVLNTLPPGFALFFFTQMEMIFKIPFAGMLRKLLMHLF